MLLEKLQLSLENKKMKIGVCENSTLKVKSFTLSSYKVNLKFVSSIISHLHNKLIEKYIIDKWSDFLVNSE